MAITTRRRRFLRGVVILGAAATVSCGLALGVRVAQRKAREATERFQLQVQLHNDEWVSETKQALRAGRQSDVYFYSTSHTDKMIRDFAGMPEIESLTFELTDLSDAGVKDIAGLPNLAELTLYGGNPRVGNDGLRCLAGHQSINKLVLINIDVTDDGLRVLSSLPALADLSLHRESFRDVRLTDAAVEHLSDLTRLKRLSISGGWMSGAAIERLRKALPNCAITTESPL